MPMSNEINRRSFLRSASIACLALSGIISPAASIPAASQTDAVEGKRVTLLHFTDSHAQLETHLDYLPGATPEFQRMGGFARLKTALEQEKARTMNACFTLDGGDDVQGAGPATWSRGETMVAPLKAMGVDVFTPGNWEATYGPERFKQTMKEFGFPVVCYNLHDIATGERLYPASIVLERQGVRVAVVGVTDIGASKRQPPDEWRGLDTSRIAGLGDYVRNLRATEKPDLVVALTHTGLTIARNLAREIPEFDVVLSGHTHERTAVPIFEGNVIVVEAGAFGSWLGRLDLVLKPGGGVAAHDCRLIPILESRYNQNPEVAALVATALAPHRARVGRAAGRTDTILMRYDVLETSADDFVSDAVRTIAATDIGFANGFRFGVPVPAAEITEGDLWNLLPMDARMKKGWITGYELKSYWEDELEMVFSRDPMKLNGGWGPRASGMTIVFDAHASKGDRVIAITVGGRAMEDDRHYTIAGCERAGEPLDVVCRHRNTHDVSVLPVTIHQALLHYLAEHPMISPRPDGREKARDLPAVVFSQDAVIAGGPLASAPTTPHGLPSRPSSFAPG